MRGPEFGALVERRPGGTSVWPLVASIRILLVPCGLHREPCTALAAQNQVKGDARGEAGGRGPG
ncbi:hypothetical protein NDU88_003181, partial [Pleurodeles waltl]